MFTTAEKTNQSTFVNRQANAGGAFFGKAEPQHSFFSNTRETGTFFSPPVQAKLSVSHPDDPQEKEADAVADQVMRMPEQVAAAESNNAPNEELQRKGEEEEVQAKQEEEEVQRLVDTSTLSISIAESVSINRQAADKEEEQVQAKSYRNIHRQMDIGGDVMREPAMAEEEETGGVQAKLIQRKKSYLIHRSGRAPPAANTHTATFEHSLSSSKGEGSPLPGNTRQFMETRFGTDFSGVRVHTDSRAENMSKSISAHAFTYGNDIYFNSGKFSPNTADGSLLLAHELTHTIQQGATPAMRKSIATKSIQLKSGIHRRIQKMDATTQRNAAVEFAKAEQGKVKANETGPDGKRFGWQRLLEFFKTTFGKDKILPEGAAMQPGTVNEGHIKTKSTFHGNVMDPNDGVTVLHNQPRDAMPSWCGIFAFWALNKGGFSMKKWELGRGFIPPEAAYPPGHEPKAGDLAYRKEFSHYALVVSSDGTNVTSINGNTAGDDNVGGEIQVQTHPKAHWFAFFDPTKIMEGSLRNPGGPENAPVRSLAELRKKLFKVNRKANGEVIAGAKEEAEEQVQVKHDETIAVQAQAETTSATNEAARVAVPEQTKEEQHGEREEELKGSSQSEFDIHRSFSINKQPVSDTTSKEEKKPEDKAPAAETTVARKTAGDNPLITNVQRQEDSLSARGPPRGPPVIGGILNRKFIQRSWLGDAWDAVSGFVSEAAEWVERGLDAAKEWLLRKVRNFVREIPGYRMLSLILGEDPITGEETPMTGANLLNAGLDLLPGGFMFRSLMNRLVIFNDVATWLQGRIENVTTLANAISARFIRFWDRLSLSDVGDPERVMNDVADLLRSTIQDIVRFVENSASEFLSMIKRVMIREIAAFVRARIPRLFPLLTVALGFNPETMETVERNGTNILNAFLELSADGQEQRKQMMETGTFQRIVGWVDRGISVFSRAYTMLRQAISNIWNYVTIENLFSPVQTFTRIYNEFSAPVRIVGQFVLDAAIEILRIIKDALMSRLSAFARETRGYSLICVIIGRDPFTGQRVPRTVHNIVKGFMSLMEGGEQQYEQLKESGAIDRIINKVNRAVAELNMTPQAIIQLFIDLWNSFSIRTLTNPIAAFRRIVATFGAPIMRLIRFVIRIIMIVIEAILILMNFPFDLINNIIVKVRQAYEMIKRDPIGFLKNLLRAIKQGFIQFFDNIATHLLNGVVGWLMAELRDANVPAPQDFSLRGIIGWVLEILGISMEAIWQKLAQHPRIGPERVARIRGMIDTLEGIWTFIKDVQERGIAAIWERIQEQLSNLWNTVLDAVKNWIMERIINAVVTRLLSMLDPTGVMAVINSAIAIYRAVQSFIQYLRQMLEIINSFVEGVVEIASGNITRAANFLEATMARGMPIVIGFLANQVGLGGIGQRIAEIIGSVREMVDRALTWLVNRAVDTAFNLLNRLMALGRSARDAVVGWARGVLGLQRNFRTTDNVTHRIYFQQSGDAVKLKLNPTPAGDYETKINEVNIPPAPNDKANVSNAISVPLMRSGQLTGNVNVPAGQVPMATLKSSAIRVSQHIDGLIRSNMRTSTDTTTGVQDQTPDFNASLEGLGQITGYLLSTSSNGPIPVSAIPTYGGLENGFAKSMDVNPLTKLGVPGTGVSITSPDYQDLLLRRENPGGRSYYIAGHLLNNNVHGSGTTWQNLTPIVQGANAEHEREVESKVKEAADKDLIMHYTVNVSYGIPEKANLVSEIEAQAGWQTNSTLSEKHRILKAEAKLPNTLTCSLKQKKADGTDLPTNDPTYDAKYNFTNVPIDNASYVTQNSLDNYYLRNATAVTYKTYTELETAANTAISANAAAIWDDFYNHVDYKVSIDNLNPPSKKDDLRNLFRKQGMINDEQVRINGLTAMQTWESFNGGRVAYGSGSLLSTTEQNALRTAFFNKMTTIKNAFLAAERAQINVSVTAGNMSWGDFRRNRGFIARSGVLEETEIQNFKTTVFDVRIAALGAATTTPGTT